MVSLQKALNEKAVSMSSSNVMRQRRSNLNVMGS